MSGLLFTDLEASTAHLRALGERYAVTLARHHELLRAAIGGEGGTEVGSEGDSLAAVLPDAASAARAALAAQRALAAEAWPDGPWRVRMAVHVGDVATGPAGTTGVALHEAARLRNIGHGGQVLVSEAARLELGDGFELRDLGVHAVRDLERPTRVHQLVVPDLPASFPPLRTAARLAIPRAGSSFIGREAEVEAVVELLAGAPLVTIVGPGGAGKTRVAYASAEALGSDAVVVELAPRSAAEVAAAIADAVGAPDAGSMAATIAGSDLLLVLDNCEHVLEPLAALIPPLLAAGSEVRVLATSREPLAIGGEVVWQLPELSAEDAEALFLGRAAAVGAEVAPADAAAVCAQLQGLPLAIELAAARLRSLPIDELVARLPDQLAVLTGGRRDVPRHQTMRATVEWSASLLAPGERAALHHLSVFTGGFTLAAAEQVLDGRAGIDVLDALVHKSLLRFDRATGRYSMLEPVRQHAGEQLAAAGEDAVAREAHLRWVQGLVRDAPLRFHLDHQAMADLFAAEAANLRAAVDWALEVRPDDAATLASKVAQFWFTTSRWEGRITAERVVERRDAMSPAGAAKALLAAGIVFVDDADARAEQWLEEAVSSFRRLGHRRALGAALWWWGRSRCVQGGFAGAEDVFEESRAIAESVGDAFGEGWALIWLAIVARFGASDLDRAEALAHEALELGERAEVPHLVAGALGTLADLAFVRGDLNRSLELRGAAIERYRALGDRWQISIALSMAATVLRARGDRRAAASALVEALRLSSELGALRDAATGLVLASELLSPEPEPDPGGQPDRDRPWLMWLGAPLARPEAAAPRRLREEIQVAVDRLVEVYGLDGGEPARA